MLRKVKIKSQAMRDSAKGEDCTLEIAGVCNGDNSTVVLAHLPDGSGGIMGGKVDDISACYACSSCHAVIDGQVKWPGDEEILEDWYAHRANIRTLRRMVDKGVITIKGVKL